MKIIFLIAWFVNILVLGACSGLSLENIFSPNNGLTSKPSVSDDGFIIYNDIQPNYYGANSNIPVQLSNNVLAKHPSWSELMIFLELDKTDENSYIPGLRVCAEFAAELHNNAENTGVKAAWVSIEFTDNTEGHALNAFETTDKGLVFIDCTGDSPGLPAVVENLDDGNATNESSNPDSHDKIAYIIIGEEYGAISKEIASSPEYSFYLDYLENRSLLEEGLEEYNTAVKQYNEKVELYNKDIQEYESLIRGRTVISDPTEYEMLSKMYDQLQITILKLEQESTVLQQEGSYIDTQFDELGRYSWFSLGTVRDVEIYW